MDKVQQEYKKAIGNKNDNLYTLVVGSKPATGIIPLPYPRLSHCIYFGDFESNKNEKLWSRFNKVFKFLEIGTVQVPHHGAKRNWRAEMGIGDPRHYIISSGSTNGYHHPNYWVIQEIWDGGHRPFVVSEKWRTLKEYVFEV